MLMSDFQCTLIYVMPVFLGKFRSAGSDIKSPNDAMCVIFTSNIAQNVWEDRIELLWSTILLQWLFYGKYCCFNSSTKCSKGINSISWFLTSPGARPTNDISIEFEIRPKFASLWFEMSSTNHDEILHKSRQYNCRDVCKISLWSVQQVFN